jgi:SAM-dependent methyltransferase
MVYCNICSGNTKTLRVKEQMMGLQETFIYNQCLICGHTQIESLPLNISSYYDTKEYYSFKKDIGFSKSIKKIKLFLKKILTRLNVKKSILFSSALQSVLSIKSISKQSYILDYGCGNGQFVKELISLGFINTKGFDPYLSSNLKEGLPLSNNLEDLQIVSWDIILLNHVFEHLENPVSALKDLQKMLSDKGKLVLRFPVIDSFAFEKYKENWVQFDAPRHLNLFTRKSIKLLIEKIGSYKIIDMYDDSFHFQFTGSELYLKKLSLSPKHNSQLKRLLSYKTYQYALKAKKLNKQAKGDQIVLILEKI